jgi:hypothetical protein
MKGAPLVVIFCGSVNWTDRDEVRRDLEGLPPDSIVIENGGKGLAKIVREEAPKLGIYVATMRPLWEFHSKPAAYRCNEAMGRIQADYLYAYPLGESPGTEHMVRVAEEQCIQVREA